MWKQKTANMRIKHGYTSFCVTQFFLMTFYVYIET